MNELRVIEGQTTHIVPMADLERMADAIAKSGLFGVKSPVQALALMLIAQAEGSHPATAARDYHIIDGRPALKADAMLARYLSSGGKVQWHEHTDAKVSATFAHPAGGTLKIDWDMARAKAAGMGGKPMWTKYPRQMLRARVISEGIRATNPGVAVGIYTPEEVQDFAPEKDMGKAEVVQTVEAAPAKPEPQPYPAEAFSTNFPKWAKLIESGKKTSAQIIAMVGSKAILTDQQKADINAIEAPVVDAAADDFVREYAAAEGGGK